MTEQSVAETPAATKKKYPRFNHIAISLLPELLSEAGRKDLLDFYGEVFGWVELPTMTEDGKRLVMGAYSYDQFVYLHADKKGPGLTAPPRRPLGHGRVDAGGVRRVLRQGAGVRGEGRARRDHHSRTSTTSAC